MESNDENKGDISDVVEEEDKVYMYIFKNL